MSKFSEQFVQAVADGIREYNSNRPPEPMALVGDELVPTSPREQIDQEWREAVRYGLERAAAACQS